MTTVVDRRASPAGRQVLAALGARLAAVAETLHSPDRPVSTEGEPHELLHAVVERVAQDRREDEVWLLLVGVTGAFPSPSQVQAYRRLLRDSDVHEAAMAALEAGTAADPEALVSHIRVVSDRAVVDVDFTSRHDLHTGIQRVVREVSTRWHPTHPVVLTAFTDDSKGMRELEPAEQDRVLRFGLPAPEGSPSSARPGPATDGEAQDAASAAPPVRVVPWQTCVVLLEVPRASVSDPLRAAAVANRVLAVGYDCIPVVSADTVSAQEPVKFVRYLSLLKHAHTVAAISGSVGEEFAGFVDMLPTQGLTGPQVAVCSLPVEVPRRLVPPTAAMKAVPPRVLAVGSHDPRKNHLAVLHAAERMWAEGLEFQLDFVGGRGWSADAFEHEVDRLTAAGRPVRALRGTTDEQLWDLYDSSRYSVFPSLHEGYGLPVAESLARGVPVVTSDRGSTAEIAAGGGALVVDPVDDEALLAAMRTLLVDDDLLQRLATEATGRRVRTWDDYAGELWALTAGLVRS